MISLATDSRTDTGHLIFHANAGGGLACASCHPEGGEDGRVWNFACPGARRTQSIRGGISGTAPFHWDGGETDFSRLMDDVFSSRMAGPMLSSDQKAALQSVGRHDPGAARRRAGLDAAGGRARAGAVQRRQGRPARPATRARCSRTTRPSTSAPGSALQVPSLRGVVLARALHAQRLRRDARPIASPAACGGGDKHGVTSTL